MMSEMFGKEDIALVILVVTVAGAIWLFQPGGEDASGYQPSAFCQNVVEESEASLSEKAESVSCRCISGENYQTPSDTPDKVRNVTEVNDVVVCDVTANGEDRQLVYPLLEVNETRYQELYNTTNTSNLSVGGNSQLVN